MKKYRDMTEAEREDWGDREAVARLADMEIVRARGNDPTWLVGAQEKAEDRRKLIGATRAQASSMVIAANRRKRRAS